jgi:predicted dehydrogenase
MVAYMRRFAPASTEALEDRWSRGSALVREALGDVPEELGWTYRLLCRLGSHDPSAMRELLGRPERVLAARQWRKDGSIVALLDYGAYVVTYETGVDGEARFVAHIEAYGETGALKVQYGTPYVRHFPTTLVTERTVATRSRGRSSGHTSGTYTNELEHFHRVVTEAATPKTSRRDYVADMELFIELVRVMDKES